MFDGQIFDENIFDVEEEIPTVTVTKRGGGWTWKSVHETPIAQSFNIHLHMKHPVLALFDVHARISEDIISDNYYACKSEMQIKQEHSIDWNTYLSDEKIQAMRQQVEQIQARENLNTGRRTHLLYSELAQRQGELDMLLLKTNNDSLIWNLGNKYYEKYKLGKKPVDIEK